MTAPSFRFGASLGRLVQGFGGLLGVSWAVFGASWASLGRSWGPLGRLLGPSWALLGASWVTIRAQHMELEPSLPFWLKNLVGVWFGFVSLTPLS